MPLSYEVTLCGMRFHARVGVLPHERELPQPIVVDVTVWQSPTTLAQVERSPLDYRDIERVVSAVMRREPIAYLEEIGGGIVEGAMALDAVERVRVVVRKPHVALGVPLDAAQVALDVRRDG